MVKKLAVDIAISGSVHRNLLIRPTSTPLDHLVLVMPDWFGRTTYQDEVAVRLAEHGHAALCVDVYGDGRSTSDASAAEALMTPLVADRTRLTNHLAELVSRFAQMHSLSTAQLTIIGFCFGGLCALDLARTGEPYALVASFHGVLDPHPSLNGNRIYAPVAVFHGWRDPFVSPESLNQLLNELHSSGADWQSHCFGGAAHAFMMKHAAAPQHGIAYDEAVSESCWQTLLSLAATARNRSRPQRLPEATR